MTIHLTEAEAREVLAAIQSRQRVVGWSAAEWQALERAAKAIERGQQARTELVKS